MDQPDIAAAITTLGWLELIKRIGGFMVIAGVAIEVGGDWLSTPFHKKVEDARQLELSLLNTRAKEAELALEQLRKSMGPRKLDSVRFLEALAGKPTAPIEITFPKEDGEAFMLALQFRDLLRKAGWKAPEPTPIPPNQIPRLADQPSHMAAGGQATGIGVAARADTQEEMKSFTASFRAGFPGVGDDDGKPNPALEALFKAILDSLGSASSHIGGADAFNTPPKGTFRIIVGPKP